MITLNNHSIKANISQRYASIEYSYDFQNFGSNDESTELKFEMTIDPDAFISHFIADIDGEIFIGKTKEKEEAKNEYKEAKKNNENAILISKPYKDISNIFEIKTNIGKDSKISLQISIEQYLCKKFNFNQLNIQILRNFEKYNIYPTFENILFKLDIKDSSGIFDVNIPSTNSSNTSLMTGNNKICDIIIDNNTMNKLNTHCSICGKIPTVNSSLNELVLKYKVKGEQNDFTVMYDKKSCTFCHIISDIISESMVQNEEITMNEGDGDGIGDENKIKSNILIPRRVILVIDKSGSMAGSKWNKTMSSTIIALQQLRILYDRYNIILFNDKIKWLSETIMIANEQNINESIHYLQNENACGSTNIYDALSKAINLIKNDIISLNVAEYKQNPSFYMNQIIFITDGEPNRGIQDTKLIISNIKKENDLSKIDKFASKISIFSFGVGKDANDSGWINDLNHSFLKLLSLENNGIYKRIKQQNIDTSLSEYYSILSKPVLSNINIKYDNKSIVNLTNTKFHTLYSGNDLIICGQLDMKDNDQKGDDGEEEKYDDLNMDITATISAVTGKEMNNKNDNGLIITKPINISKTLQFQLTDEDNDNNANIERIWAYLKLQQFAEKKLIGKINDGKSEITPLSLAMKHKFVTPWTSMIVVKKKKRIFEVNDKEYGELLSGIREHKLKLVTIGDCNTGKTSLILRFAENIFNIKNNEVTLGVNTKNKKLKVNDKYFNISLWDTVGQERYSNNLSSMYLRNANGIIFVCDINNIESIDNIKKWAKFVNDTINFDKNNAILIVNKSDLVNNGNDVKAMNKIKQLTNNLGINYIVTSCKNNENIKNSFYKLIESIYDTMFDNKYINRNKLVNNNNNSLKNQDVVNEASDFDAGCMLDEIGVVNDSYNRAFYAESKNMNSSGCC